MSDAGDITENFVEDENKVNIDETSVNFPEGFVEEENKVKIEETCVTLDCVKTEPKEEALDFEDYLTSQYRITHEYENIFGELSQQRNFENKVDIGVTSVNCVKSEQNENALVFGEDSHTTQYRITLEYENIFGESSHQRKIKEDYDNLIGFMDNDVIMENAMIKLEYVKEEDRSFNSFHCCKCKEDYLGFCLKCATLSHILNNNALLINSESNSIPTDILEIRENSTGKGVFLLRTLPINVIFGPFEGILGIESIIGHCWKIKDNKLVNIKNGNWMKNVVCASNASIKNLDVFQIDGNLYFQTNREITEGEELFIYYDDKELQQSNNSEECLYTPQKYEKLPKIFACTLCCLGFTSNKCLMEHKRKCPQMDHSRSMKELELIECHYCKMWMEKWEHEEHHVAYCLEKHHRMWCHYSEPVDRYGTDAEDVEGNYGTRGDKRRYQRGMCSKSYDGRDNLHFQREDYQCFSGTNNETHLNKYASVECTKNEDTKSTIEKKYKCLECSYRTNYKCNFQKHLNEHRDIKSFQCDICKMKFTRKDRLREHIKNKHTGNEHIKDYRCPKCSFQTNYKHYLKTHINTHTGIKPFQCDICMIKFTQEGSLKKHIKNKHTESSEHYQCSECSFQTKYKHCFQRHLNKHSAIKQFQCVICMVKFTRKDTFREHIKNKHTGNELTKDYKCSECSYKTNGKHNLDRHMNTHTGIKPFECGICMLKFTQKVHLKSHVKNKHTESGNVKHYQCAECSFQTKYKQGFQRHLNKHRDIKTFKCDICLKKFTRKCSLKRHNEQICKIRTPINTKAPIL